MCGPGDFAVPNAERRRFIADIVGGRIAGENRTGPVEAGDQAACASLWILFTLLSFSSRVFLKGGDSHMSVASWPSGFPFPFGISTGTTGFDSHLAYSFFSLYLELGTGWSTWPVEIKPQTGRSQSIIEPVSLKKDNQLPAEMEVDGGGVKTVDGRVADKYEKMKGKYVWYY